MSGGKKLLFTFVLAVVAFAYQYVRSGIGRDTDL